MKTITNKDKDKILDLYFNAMYNQEKIQNYFKNKYTISQIRTIIHTSYKNYKGTTITKMPLKKKNKIN